MKPYLDNLMKCSWFRALAIPQLSHLVKALVRSHDRSRRMFLLGSSTAECHQNTTPRKISRHGSLFSGLLVISVLYFCFAANSAESNEMAAAVAYLEGHFHNPPIIKNGVFSQTNLSLGENADGKSADPTLYEFVAQDRAFLVRLYTGTAGTDGEETNILPRVVAGRFGTNTWSHTGGVLHELTVKNTTMLEPGTPGVSAPLVMEQTVMNMLHLGINMVNLDTFSIKPDGSFEADSLGLGRVSGKIVAVEQGRPTELKYRIGDEQLDIHVELIYSDNSSQIAGYPEEIRAYLGMGPVRKLGAVTRIIDLTTSPTRLPEEIFSSSTFMAEQSTNQTRVVLKTIGNDVFYRRPSGELAPVADSSGIWRWKLVGFRLIFAILILATFAGIFWIRIRSATKQKR